MNRLALFFLLLLSLPALAQEETLAAYEKEKLQPLCTQLLAAKTDADKRKLSGELQRQLDSTLNVSQNFSYPFDSLRKCISILVSPDNRFRIIHWNLPLENGSNEYYGFIQSKFVPKGKRKGIAGRNEVIQLYPLTDRSSEIRNPDNAITDHNKWLGMWYYKIIIKKTRSKTYYTLLAWDGNDKFTTRKIIDVLTFDSKGTPKFGADIFVMNKKYPRRVIFEYSSSCSMSLKYSPKKDSIVFDHLAPTEPQLTGQFQYYCSDMSYDGFGFKRGKWHYGKDINAVNEKDENDRLYRDPHDRSHTSSQSDGLNKFDREEISQDPNYRNFKKKEKKKKSD